MVTTLAAAPRQGGPSVGLPEGVFLAPIGRRLAAFVVDALAPYVLLIIALSVTAAGGSGWLAAILFLLPLAWAALQWWLCATRAATVGMRLMRLQVVGLRDGRPIGWVRALVRGLILSLVGGSLIVLIVMGVMMLGQLRRQGWHDLAVDSVVIEERPLAPRAQRLPRGRRALELTTAPTAAAVGAAPAHSSAEPTMDPTASPVGPLPGPVPGGSPVMQPVLTGREPELLPDVPEDLTDGADQTDQVGRPGDESVAEVADGWSAPRAAAADLSDGPVAAAGEAGETEQMGQPTPPPPNQGWYAVLDDDQELPITRLILFGRNPQPRPGEEDALLVKVVDEARTVSKTHLALFVDSRGVLVADRGSTNGSAVTDPYGIYQLLTADEPVRLPTEGYLVSFGNHQLRIVRH
jgi:uncharacterized RDD family membrane protein YckC